MKQDDLPFSKRYGYEPIEVPFQLEGINRTLRTHLWNAFHIHIYQQHERDSRNARTFHKIIWIHFFDQALDDFPEYDYQFRDFIRNHIENGVWHKVYEFFEFIFHNIQERDNFNYLYEYEGFEEYVNNKLKDYNSAYTLTGNKFIPVTNQAEVDEIKETQYLAKEYGLSGIQEHLNASLDLISRKPLPDLRNSIKESISMVEVISRIIEPKENTLGKALNKLDKNEKINANLKAGFEKLYVYTNDKNGIRHALMHEESIEIEDAKFFLISCSAFTNYLIEKAKKDDLLK